MADTKTKSAKSGDEVARGADVPLALAGAGPRDALLDPQPHDIIPDAVEKGYHVGEVRQPAEPVLKRSGTVDFESLPGAGESKFTSSYAEDVRKLDAATSSDPAYAGTVHVPIETDPERVAKREKELQGDRGEGRRESREASPSKTKPSKTATDLEDDAADVAASQAADDKADN